MRGARVFVWVRLAYLLLVIVLGIVLYYCIPRDVKQAIYQTYFARPEDGSR